MDKSLAWRRMLSVRMASMRALPLLRTLPVRRSRIVLGLPALALAGMLAFGPGPRSITPAAASETDAPKMIAAKVAPVEFPRAVPQSKRQMLLASFIAQRWYLPGEQALALVRIAHRAAVKRSLDPVLILAMIAVESSFNPEAVSPAGAKGLMQVIPEFHPDKFSDATSVFDPETNVLAGTRILKEYLAQSGDLDVALQRYAGASADGEMVYANRIQGEVDRINAAMGAVQRPL